MIDFIEITECLGKIRNDSQIEGIAYIFIFVPEGTEKTMGILFLHPNIEPFITLSDKDSCYSKELLLSLLNEKYNFSELIGYDNKKLEI